MTRQDEHPMREEAKPIDRERVRELLRQGRELRDAVREKYESERTVSEKDLRLLVD